MDSEIIKLGADLGLTTICVGLQAYNMFRKTNVEKYFKKLLDEGILLTKIDRDEELRGKFFWIFEKVINELNEKKIDSWKNATINLATGFSDFPLQDNFLKSLDTLTVFDLLVLEKVYSTDFQDKHFEVELVNFFEKRDVKSEYVMQAVKHLASHCFVDEMYNRVGVFADGGKALAHMHHAKNDLGLDFLRFVGDEYRAEKKK